MARFRGTQLIILVVMGCPATSAQEVTYRNLTQSAFFRCLRRNCDIGLWATSLKSDLHQQNKVHQALNELWMMVTILEMVSLSVVLPEMPFDQASCIFSNRWRPRNKNASMTNDNQPAENRAIPTRLSSCSSEQSFP